MNAAADRRHRVLVRVELLTGASALACGGLLAVRPDGSLMGLPLSVLAVGPFTDWRLPGLLLGGLVGGGYLMAGAAEQTRRRYRRPLSLVAGAGLVVFEVVERRWLGPHPLQVVFMLVGGAVVALSVAGPDAGGVRVTTGVDLFWLPLGAGGHSVRWNGRVYEAACALLERRAAHPLYHSALHVSLPSGSWIIEMTPVWAVSGSSRGVVAQGSVGTREAGRLRLFRYEVHCWRDGVIADLDEAVGGPVHLSSDADACRRLLAVLPQVPRAVWGRDEQRTGEMWNSNSVTAWALSRGGIDASALLPPGDGRAPGWAAGLVVAGRQHQPQSSPP